MKLWKIGLSVIVGLLTFFSIMNVITGGFNINGSTAAITPSIFYTGVIIIVLSIVILCVVIINCTPHIIKAINDKKM